MPVNTGVGLMSLGKDVSVDVVLPDGRHLNLGNVTGFDPKPITKELASSGIDGVPRHAVVPEGWTLTFDVDREGPNVDNWWAAFEVAYYSGNVLYNATILETIDEPDGSISQWRYVGCALKLDDAGARKSDNYIKMKVTGKASHRIKVR